MRTDDPGAMVPRTEYQARLVTRARVVLSAAEGKENKDIAANLTTSRGVVARWRDRFDELGVTGLEKDARRGGRPPRHVTTLSVGSSR